MNYTLIIGTQVVALFKEMADVINCAIYSYDIGAHCESDENGVRLYKKFGNRMRLVGRVVRYRERRECNNE